MRKLGLAAWAVLSAAGLPALAYEDPPPTEIVWRASLRDAIEEAKKAKKPVFVAITAERVDGLQRLEPAGIELRERTYKHPDVVAKSREFVSVLLKDPIDSDNGGELRSRFGMDGLLVSPQHLFLHADGTLIRRKEYWEFSRDSETSVKALLGYLDEALKAHRARTPGAAAPTPTAPPPPPPTAPPPAAPSGGAPDAPPTDARSTWIRETLERVKAGDPDGRAAAARELAAADAKGDCVGPLSAYLLEVKDQRKEHAIQLAILRALGRPGLEPAVPGLVAFLEAKDVEARSNAAVSLEYVGSASAIEGLTKRVSREKEDAVHSNLCRALGRCGARVDAVRKTLLKEYASAKNDRVAIGPIIGLAYSEKDEDTARALEKALKKEGNRVKRGTLVWALVEVGDPGSLPLLREILAEESNPLAKGYLGGAVAALAGSGSKSVVEQGLGGLYRWNDISWDDARKGREGGGFVPKADAAGMGGGGPPGRPGG
jgi:hypothetical protein